jgi:hypothetical protein
MKLLVNLAIMICICGCSRVKDVPASPKPLIKQIAEEVTKLANDGGFTDDDAVFSAKMFFIGLVGLPEDYSLPKDHKLNTEVRRSTTPEIVTVFVSYDFGIGFIGYDFTFHRGDVSKGMRYANFQSLQVVPSE